MNHGFLNSAAPWGANLTLALEIGMGVGLLIGALLARMRRFGPHAWCQSAVVLLNLALIAATMVPSFRQLVVPALPAKLGKPYYALAAAHAALGTVAQGAGLYVLLAVGTKLLPERLRITRLKLWMRSLLVLWWIVLALGLATYVDWYIPRRPAARSDLFRSVLLQRRQVDLVLGPAGEARLTVKRHRVGTHDQRPNAGVPSLDGGSP